MHLEFQISPWLVLPTHAALRYWWKYLLILLTADPTVCHLAACPESSRSSWAQMILAFPLTPIHFPCLWFVNACTLCIHEHPSLDRFVVTTHPASSFCNPYWLCIVIPMSFFLIMSLLHMLVPARIDWSCPMLAALYLCSYNPQTPPAKIIVQPQRTLKSHIHCIFGKKSLKMAVSNENNGGKKVHIFCFPRGILSCTCIVFLIWLLCGLGPLESVSLVLLVLRIYWDSHWSSNLSVWDVSPCSAARLMCFPLFYYVPSSSYISVLFCYLPRVEFCFCLGTFLLFPTSPVVTLEDSLEYLIPFQKALHYNIFFYSFPVNTSLPTLIFLPVTL